MMYKELVARLRGRARREDEYYAHGGDVINEAADVIEGLSGLVDYYGGETGIKGLLDIAKRYYDLLEKMPRWISVTERLPRMWEEVMLQFPNNQAVGFHDGDSGWAVFSGDNFYTYVAPEEVHPTHWMPLPEPPEEET